MAAEAQAVGLVRTHGDATVGLALRHERQGDPETAIELYKRAQELKVSLAPTAAAAGVAGKARCLIMSGDIRYAIHVLERHLLVLGHAGLDDPDSLARLHVTLVAAYHETGVYKKAFASASEALRLSPLIRDQEIAAAMNLNVARSLLERGDVEEAQRCLLRAEDLYSRLELRDQLARPASPTAMYLAVRGT